MLTVQESVISREPFWLNHLPPLLCKLLFVLEGSTGTRNDHEIYREQDSFHTLGFLVRHRPAENLLVYWYSYLQ